MAYVNLVIEIRYPQVIKEPIHGPVDLIEALADGLPGNGWKENMILNSVDGSYIVITLERQDELSSEQIEWLKTNLQEYIVRFGAQQYTPLIQNVTWL